MLSYSAAIDLSSRTLRYAVGLLRRHRQMIGSRWRKLGCSRQALLVLAHLRCGDTYTRLAAGFGVGVATVYRYVAELVDLLARHAPDLAAAMDAARRKAYVVLDGTSSPPSSPSRPQPEPEVGKGSLAVRTSV